MGTSCKTKKLVGDLEDHPHACGDKSTLLRPCVLLQGSSPRVWGQVHICRYLCKSLRIIPTRVGTSIPDEIVFVTGGDHPHACGDKSKIRFQSEPDTGSSPRVWGQGNISERAFLLSGIIPTRVGTSTIAVLIVCGLEDHPHACGDKTKEIKENSGFSKSTA